MKKGYVFICTVVFLFGMQSLKATIPGNGSPGEVQGERPGTSKSETLEVLCSPDLEGVMQECLDAYRLKTGSSVGYQLMEDQTVGTWLEQSGHFALLTKYHMDQVDPQDARVFVIGREVYVPVMHPENPYLNEVRQKGISPKEFAALYTSTQDVTWGALLQNGSEKIVHAYRASDPSFTAYLSDFAGGDSELTGGKVLQNCEMVVQAVKKDRFGIGFCTLSQLRNMQEEKSLDALAMVPVDLNGNDRLDHFEAIYGDVDELYRGIWIGKYTGSLYSRIFAVLPAGNIGPGERSFLSWLIGDGQEVLAVNGYSTLLENEQGAMLASLDQPTALPAAGDAEDRAGLGLLIAVVVVGLGIVVYLVLRAFADRNPTPESMREAAGTSFVAGSSEVPAGYYYDRSHTWAFQERDGNIRVGLDSFIEKLTGPITRIEMKDRGEQVRKGRTLFTLVQNGKRMDIKSPVSGKVQSHNEKLRLNAALINSHPFSEGWIYTIEPTNWTEEQVSLFRVSRYREWIKSEFARLKDFLAQVRNTVNSPVVVLQEGGEVREGILEELGPEVWDDFQTDFLRN